MMHCSSTPRRVCLHHFPFPFPCPCTPYTPYTSLPSPCHFLAFFLISIARRFILVRCAREEWEERERERSEESGVRRGCLADPLQVCIGALGVFSLNHCDYLYSRFSCRSLLSQIWNKIFDFAKSAPTTKKGRERSTSTMVYPFVLHYSKQQKLAKRLDATKFLFNFTLSDFVE